jgi:hypothetical protein
MPRSLLLTGILAVAGSGIEQSGLTVSSSANPLIILRVAEGFVPQPPINIALESTDVDRRVFVEADASRHIERLVIFQFERVRPGKAFKFVYPPKPPFTFGSSVYRVGTYVYDDAAESALSPERESGITRAALMKSGYVVPRMLRTARLARVSDAEGKSELIIFYMENADDEYPGGSLPGTDQDGDLVLIDRAAQALLRRMSSVISEVPVAPT